MRNKRSKLLLSTGISAILLGTSSMAQPHETPDPVDTTPVTDSVPDQPASSVAQAQATTDQGTARTSTAVMEQDASTSANSKSMQATNAAGSSMERDQSSRSSGGMQGGDTAWILIPVAMQSQSDQMTRGCWVRLYSGDDFEGRYLTIAGPADIRELRSPYGTGMNNWESAEVGPSATVTTFDDEEFRARNATLRPGMRYAKLDDSKLGLFEDIESLRVRCGGSQGMNQSSSGTSGS